MRSSAPQPSVRCIAIPFFLHTLPLNLPCPIRPPGGGVTTKAGVPAHTSVISARCPYLIGHIEAARKSSPPSPATGNGDDARNRDNDGDGGEDAKGGAGVSKTVALCLEHASADTVRLLARYLYTDEVPAADVAGETLDALAGLAQELLLPR